MNPPKLAAAEQLEAYRLRVCLGYRAAAIALLSFCIPDYGSVTYAFLWKQARTGSLPDDAKFACPSLKSMLCPPTTYDPAKIDAIRKSMLTNKNNAVSQFEFAIYVNEGLKLLQGRTDKDSRIATYDFCNPFPVALQLPTARGSIGSWTPCAFLDESHHPPPDIAFANVTHVMVPKRPIIISSLQFGERVCGSYVREHFRRPPNHPTGRCTCGNRSRPLCGNEFAAGRPARNRAGVACFLFLKMKTNSDKAEVPVSDAAADSSRVGGDSTAAAKVKAESGWEIRHAEPAFVFRMLEPSRGDLGRCVPLSPGRDGAPVPGTDGPQVDLRRMPPRRQAGGRRNARRHALPMAPLLREMQHPRLARPLERAALRRGRVGRQTAEAVLDRLVDSASPSQKPCAATFSCSSMRRSRTA